LKKYLVDDSLILFNIAPVLREDGDLGGGERQHGD
jgi:hypothetical protein